MSKTKLTRRIITGLVILVGASGAVTVANEFNNAAVNVNKKDVKASIYEKNGHYYVKLTTAKNVTNVVVRVTTEDRKEYVVKKEAIKVGEVVEYEIDVNADVPARKLPHTGVKRETVKSVVTLGNHTFNTVVSYDVEVADSQEQAPKLVDKNTENKTTLDQLADKREVTAEQKAKEEAEAKKVAETKAAVDAKAKEAEAKKAAEVKQTTTVAGGLPEVTAAELADPAMKGLTPHTKKMKVALAKKFGITSFSLFREGDDDGTGHGHNTGMAVDFMVYSDSAKGDQLAEYLTKHMDELGIYYIIWKQRFYMSQQNIYGPANTWNIMPNRGGITANHYDHVHVSFKK